MRRGDCPNELRIEGTDAKKRQGTWRAVAACASLALLAAVVCTVRACRAQHGRDREEAWIADAKAELQRMGKNKQQLLSAGSFGNVRAAWDAMELWSKGNKAAPVTVDACVGPPLPDGGLLFSLTALNPGRRGHTVVFMARTPRGTPIEILYTLPDDWGPGYVAFSLYTDMAWRPWDEFLRRAKVRKAEPYDHLLLEIDDPHPDAWELPEGETEIYVGIEDRHGLRSNMVFLRQYATMEQWTAEGLPRWTWEDIKGKEKQ